MDRNQVLGFLAIKLKLDKNELTKSYQSHIDQHMQFSQQIIPATNIANGATEAASPDLNNHMPRLFSLLPEKGSFELTYVHFDSTAIKDMLIHLQFAPPESVKRDRSNAGRASASDAPKKSGKKARRN